MKSNSRRYAASAGLVPLEPFDPDDAIEEWIEGQIDEKAFEERKYLGAYTSLYALQITNLNPANGSYGDVLENNLTKFRRFVRVYDVWYEIYTASSLVNPITSNTADEPSGSTQIQNEVAISKADYDAAVIAGTLVSTTRYLITG